MFVRNAIEPSGGEGRIRQVERLQQVPQRGGKCRGSWKIRETINDTENSWDLCSSQSCWQFPFIERGICKKLNLCPLISRYECIFQ